MQICQVLLTCRECLRQLLEWIFCFAMVNCLRHHYLLCTLGWWHDRLDFLIVMNFLTIFMYLWLIDISFNFSAKIRVLFRIFISRLFCIWGLFVYFWFSRLLIIQLWIWIVHLFENMFRQLLFRFQNLNLDFIFFFLLIVTIFKWLLFWLLSLGIFLEKVWIFGSLKHTLPIFGPSVIGGGKTSRRSHSRLPILSFPLGKFDLSNVCLSGCNRPRPHTFLVDNCSLRSSCRSICLWVIQIIESAKTYHSSSSVLLIRWLSSFVWWTAARSISIFSEITCCVNFGIRIILRL